MGPNQNKFLLVIVNYFSKWMEAEAYRTTPRESTSATPFQLVYGGGGAIVPVDIGVRLVRVEDYNAEENNLKRRVELDLLVEAWEEAATRLCAYKRRMSQIYNKKVIPYSLLPKTSLFTSKAD